MIESLEVTCGFWLINRAIYPWDGRQKSMIFVSSNNRRKFLYPICFLLVARYLVCTNLRAIRVVETPFASIF
jgi:hypothetical protein